MPTNSDFRRTILPPHCGVERLRMPTNSYFRRTILPPHCGVERLRIPRSVYPELVEGSATEITQLYNMGR